MSDGGIFTYSCLGDDANAIRLVRIIGYDDLGYLNIAIEHAVVQAESYIALSYVWGNNPAVYRIRLNGCLFHIRPNLWSFLATCGLNGQMIWVDALCIDQNNVSEKNRQVPLMGRIFSQASRVVCWLHGGMGTAHRDRNARWIQDMQHTDFSHNAELIAHDLLRLSKHSYWSRLWIVQELQLGQKIEIHWEGHVLSGERLAYVLDTDILERTGVLQNARIQEPDEVYTLQSLLKRRDTLLLGQTHGVDLFTLVVKYGHLLGSLRQDRVYALLALAEDGATFKVDYTESHTTLLARLLHHCNNPPQWNDMMEVAHSLGIESEKAEFEILGLCKDSSAVSQSRAKYNYERCRHCFQQRGNGHYPDLVVGIPNVIYFGLTNSYTIFGPTLLGRPDFTNTTMEAHAGLAHTYSVSGIVDANRVRSVLESGQMHQDDFTLLKETLSHFSFAVLAGSNRATFQGALPHLIELIMSTRRVGALWRSCRWITCAQVDLEPDRDTICKHLLRSYREMAEVGRTGLHGHSQHDILPIPRVVRWEEALGYQRAGSLVHFILIENQQVKTWEEVNSIIQAYSLLRTGVFSYKPKDEMVFL